MRDTVEQGNDFGPTDEVANRPRRAAAGGLGSVGGRGGSRARARRRRGPAFVAGFVALNGRLYSAEVEGPIVILVRVGFGSEGWRVRDRGWMTAEALEAEIAASRAMVVERDVTA